jgi:manganese oxidase
VACTVEAVMPCIFIRHLVAFLFALNLLASAEQLPAIAINQNHTPAGELKDGVLSLQFKIGKGEWHPESEDGMSLAVYAFGEAGRSLQNPGPLIRVPQGTEINASLHNTLNVPVTVHGLADPGSDAVVHLEAGATQEVKFKATTSGLYFYWGSTEADDLKLRHGVDSELTGAFVIDPLGASSKDEIFVIELISDLPGPGGRQTLATINGKSWPYTERFRYEIGDETHWRWINATNEPHALHLHGFYYHVDAINRNNHIETYTGDSRPMVVTQRILVGSTMDTSWSPDRPGQWLFHCHMIQHMIPAVVPSLPGLSVKNAALEQANNMHDHSGMGQMVLGITVPAKSGVVSATEWRAQRKLQLEISERPGAPRFAVRLNDPDHAKTGIGAPPGLIGPAIVLTRGEPVEIEVLNKLASPTAIHWHGIELESYYDGVPGWSGADKQITPPIASGSSFVARMAPPRAGTFIYHTHWHDSVQLTNGVYGPLIVLPPGEKFDPESDLIFLFSIGDFGNLGEMALINGTPDSQPRRLQAGKKYRMRFINISTNNQGMQVSLRGDNGPLEWKVIAKDGADLPASIVHQSKADATITVGETFDAEFTSDGAQDVLLDLLRPGLKMHTVQVLSFVAPGLGKP